jgi:hypothetical protein
MPSRGPVLIVTGNQTVEDACVRAFRDRRIFAISVSSPAVALALLEDLRPRAIVLDWLDGPCEAERRQLLAAAGRRAIPVLAMASGTAPHEPL